MKKISKCFEVGCFRIRVQFGGCTVICLTTEHFLHHVMFRNVYPWTQAQNTKKKTKTKKITHFQVIKSKLSENI